MACLQIYWELLSLTTFLRVHSNSEEVSYLSWRNTYPNLNTTWHIKLKFFLRTKLLEKLLLAKYLVSVAANLSAFKVRVLFSVKFNFCPLVRIFSNTTSLKKIEKLTKTSHQWECSRKIFLIEQLVHKLLTIVTRFFDSFIKIPDLLKISILHKLYLARAYQDNASACNFTKGITPPWMFFTFFKLYKW